MFPMLKYREKHPTNLVLLALFTLCCSLSIAVSASSTLGMDSRSSSSPSRVVGFLLRCGWMKTECGVWSNSGGFGDLHQSSA